MVLPIVLRSSEYLKDSSKARRATPTAADATNGRVVLKASIANAKPYNDDTNVNLFFIDYYILFFLYSFGHVGYNLKGKSTCPTSPIRFSSGISTSSNVIPLVSLHR